MRAAFAPLILLAVAAGCAAAPAARPQIRDAPGEAASCALRVDFGSYAKGIDRGAAQTIERTILSARGVRDVTRHRWGREGEYSLCVATASSRAASALFDRLTPLLPAKPHGPIALTLADGRNARAPKR